MGRDKRLNSKYCHLCGRRLRGLVWKYGWSDVLSGDTVVVCQRCHETIRRCDMCDHPMRANHACLPDGRHVCVRCHRSAVYDWSRARALFERTTRIVMDQLGLRLNVGTDFAMADQQDLRRLAEQAHPVLQEELDSVVGLFVRKGCKRVMYVLYGLPEIALIETIAHEWAHAWQRESCPLLQDRLIREGFAEWAAYKALRAMDSTMGWRR